MRNILHLLAFAYLMFGCSAHVEHLQESDCTVWTSIDNRTNSGGVSYGKMAAVYEVQLEPQVERTLRVHLDVNGSAVIKINVDGRGGLFVRADEAEDVHVRIPGFDQHAMMICTRTTQKGNTFLSPPPCDRGMKEVQTANLLLTHLPLNTEITVVSYKKSATTIDLIMLHDAYHRELERD
jgi:hypothetical protein